MTQIRRKKGFTLAELLVVIAIIAVLVAVAIPVFKNQVEKAKEATDLADIRSAYAEVMTEVIGNGNEEFKKTVDLVQSVDGWLSGSTAQATLESLGEVTGTPVAGGACEVSFNKDAKKIKFNFTGTSSGGGGSGTNPGDPGTNPGGGSQTGSYDTPVDVGAFRAQTLEQALKDIIAAGGNVNGIIGDDSSVGGFNLQYFAPGNGGSITVNGKKYNIAQYLSENTAFDYSKLPDTIIKTSLSFYTTKDGDVPVFSYNHEVPSSIPNRMQKVTTFYDSQGNEIGHLDGQIGSAESKAWVNDYLANK